MDGRPQVTLRQKLTWTFLLGAPLVFALLVCQCSCSSPPKWPVELPPEPQPKSQFEISMESRGYYLDGVERKAAPQTNVISLVPWRYPPITNNYQWSLETTTDFKTWQVVTNYPVGYTNDAVVTNSYDSMPHWYRMHGRL